MNGYNKGTDNDVCQCSLVVKFKVGYYLSNSPSLALYFCIQPRLLFVAHLHLPKAAKRRNRTRLPRKHHIMGRWPIGLLLLYQESGFYTIIFCQTPTQPLSNLRHHGGYEWISQCPLRGRFIAPTFIQQLMSGYLWREIE